MARRELGWEMLDKPVESHGRFKTHRGQLRLRWIDRKRQKETDRKRQGLSWERLTNRKLICFHTPVLTFSDLG